MVLFLRQRQQRLWQRQLWFGSAKNASSAKFLPLYLLYYFIIIFFSIKKVKKRRYWRYQTIIGATLALPRRYWRYQTKKQTKMNKKNYSMIVISFQPFNTLSFTFILPYSYLTFLNFDFIHFSISFLYFDDSFE